MLIGPQNKRAAGADIALNDQETFDRRFVASHGSFNYIVYAHEDRVARRSRPTVPRVTYRACICRENPRVFEEPFEYSITIIRGC